MFILFIEIVNEVDKYILKYLGPTTNFSFLDNFTFYFFFLNLILCSENNTVFYSDLSKMPLLCFCIWTIVQLDIKFSFYSYLSLRILTLYPYCVRHLLLRKKSVIRQLKKICHFINITRLKISYPLSLLFLAFLIICFLIYLY